ncbi:pseudouridine-5'-phosphate glycosidase [Paenalkalicoccus suaedae]|uniref:Pseudouridine-5'-phosphate glycosidase n=1 Tax=Paenalkalicoccus suaedae TaxID=2592382 RepID=A0A859FK62_9BACI|nr:pseudouridine-5'-phosphate glycosidase [Paenalkalicoccus suaedae]QKS73195.1 pseudouridine-5'-phosphate glycosidase [Paenalkalicoccus suaedae]
MEKYVKYSEEVKQAMEAGKPIVALESTIISHGMPYPQNVEMATTVERIIRDNGAVPATIAIMDGNILIGLSEEELERLATAKDVKKVSRRDLASVVADGSIGATTVAATMICAEIANIAVFVTGGIGGVHRGAETTMDISADLQELAQTNVAVVCAGAKSILDIGLTLEYLETNGVPVIGYQSEAFPAFYNRDSGFGVDIHATDAEAVASTMKVKWDLELDGGIVVANPVPEESELKKEYMDGILEQALREADEQGVKGKDTTPFLLARLKEISEGETLKTNIALVYHNAKVGAEIAVAYNRK